MKNTQGRTNHSLGCNNMTPDGASALFDSLKVSNSSIKSIMFGLDNSIDDSCIKSLGGYIKENKSIEKIYLNHTQISDAGIKELVPYLAGNTTFKSLDIVGNRNITDLSTPLLMKMTESSQIEDIIVIDTSIKDPNVLILPLAVNFMRNGSSEFNYSHRYMKDDKLMEICEKMKQHGIDKMKKIT